MNLGSIDKFGAQYSQQRDSSVEPLENLSSDLNADYSFQMNYLMHCSGGGVKIAENQHMSGTHFEKRYKSSMKATSKATLSKVSTELEVLD